MKIKTIGFLFLVVIFFVLIALWKTTDEPIVNLITKNEESGEIGYISVYPNKRSDKINSFESDNFEIYTADSNTFTSYISDNKVLNKLNKIALRDSKENIVKIDKEMENIFKIVEKLEHEIFVFQIISIEDRLFVLVRLNVNWQSPNDFYEYDRIENSLNILTTLQEDYITGISLPKEE